MAGPIPFIVRNGRVSIIIMAYVTGISRYSKKLPTCVFITKKFDNVGIFRLITTATHCTKRTRMVQGTPVAVPTMEVAVDPIMEEVAVVVVVVVVVVEDTRLQARFVHSCSIILCR